MGAKGKRSAGFGGDSPDLAAGEPSTPRVAAIPAPQPLNPPTHCQFQHRGAEGMARDSARPKPVWRLKTQRYFKMCGSKKKGGGMHRLQDPSGSANLTTPHQRPPLPDRHTSGRTNLPQPNPTPGKRQPLPTPHSRPWGEGSLRQTQRYSRPSAQDRRQEKEQ